MNSITFTKLQTRNKELVKLLQLGKAVNLIYRPKIVGKIKPKKEIPLVSPGGDFATF